MVGTGKIRFPHFFQTVELPDFRAEQVHDDVAGIYQDPVALLHSLGFDSDQSLRLQRLNQRLGERDDLPRRPPGRDHHVVADRRLPVKIYRNDIFSLMVFQHFLDKKFELCRADGGFVFFVRVVRLGQ